jgi:signal transduction histidine kinase
VAKTDARILIGNLRDGASKLSTLQDANSAVYRLFALDKAYSRERSTLDFTARLQRVRDLATASDDVTDSGAERLAALIAALDTLGATDAKLRDALAGKFSREERSRIARENRKQLFSILSQVAAIFPPL